MHIAIKEFRWFEFLLKSLSLPGVIGMNLSWCSHWFVYQFVWDSVASDWHDQERNGYMYVYVYLGYLHQLRWIAHLLENRTCVHWFTAHSSPKIPLLFENCLINFPIQTKTIYTRVWNFLLLFLIWNWFVYICTVI